MNSRTLRTPDTTVFCPGCGMNKPLIAFIDPVSYYQDTYCGGCRYRQAHENQEASSSPSYPKDVPKPVKRRIRGIKAVPQASWSVMKRRVEHTGRVFVARLLYHRAAHSLETCRL